MLNFWELKQLAFGLDISDRSLKIAQLKKNGHFFKLVSFNEVSLKPGLVNGGEIRKPTELAEIIKKAVKEVKGGKIRTRNVVLTLPEKKAFLEVISMPRLSESDLKSAIIWEAENHIPLPLEKVYLDYQIIPSPVNQNLNKIDVLLAAFPLEIIDSYLACLTKANLKPVVLEPESLAISRVLIPQKEIEQPFFLIDFGATRTIFIIFAFGSVRFVFLPNFSSSQLDEAIAQAKHINLVKAEKLKIKYGLADKSTEIGQQVFACLWSLVNELIGQIKTYLAYGEREIQQRIERILISGGGAKLKGLAPLLSAELNLPVDIANPWVNLRKDSTPDLQKEFLNYAGVLGAALRGITEQN